MVDRKTFNKAYMNVWRYYNGMACDIDEEGDYIERFENRMNNNSIDGKDAASAVEHALRYSVLGYNDLEYIVKSLGSDVKDAETAVEIVRCMLDRKTDVISRAVQINKICLTEKPFYNCNEVIGMLLILSMLTKEGYSQIALMPVFQSMYDSIEDYMNGMACDEILYKVLINSLELYKEYGSEKEYSSIVIDTASMLDRRVDSLISLLSPEMGMKAYV